VVHQWAVQWVVRGVADHPVLAGVDLLVGEEEDLLVAVGGHLLGVEGVPLQ
jgi:hypothetical protein